MIWMLRSKPSRYALRVDVAVTVAELRRQLVIVRDVTDPEDRARAIDAAWEALTESAFERDGPAFVERVQAGGDLLGGRAQAHGLCAQGATGAGGGVWGV